VDFFKDVFDCVNLIVIQILLNKVVDEDFSFTVTNEEFVILIKPTIGDKRNITFFLLIANVFCNKIIHLNFFINELFEIFFF
jgi:hypothetical protein